MYNPNKLTLTINSKKDYTKPTLIFVSIYFLFSAFILYGSLFYKEEPKPEIKGDKVKAKVVEYTPEEEKVGDIEILLPYQQDLTEYIKNVSFFITFTDTLFLSLLEDIPNETLYMQLLNEGGTNCLFKNYEGDKEELPSDILIKVSNIEKLMDSYCKKIEESSSLMLLYKQTTDTDKMLEYLKKIREINPEAYNEGILIEKICREVGTLY